MQILKQFGALVMLKFIIDACSKQFFLAGWWFEDCYTANLNGEYFADGIADRTSAGIQWRGVGYKGKFKVYVGTVMRLTRN